MILISSCLLGICTKYDGASNDCPLLMEYRQLGLFIPICPEQLGGLPTPRSPAEIVNGSGELVLAGLARVRDREGHDYTSQFLKGACEVIKIAGSFPIRAAVLKERSPSCGSSQIYDGSFSGIALDGQGVTTALLRKRGIPVYSEENLNRALLEELMSVSQRRQVPDPI
ncbi:MAG: DUF523 domain-containing protein [Firmicutes bacterium HGW-Firmicutes-8]|nr:MAG: DUF523 domain-containing protein [Firmicutes bacterium HGW-Firmicutes-8]